MFFRNLVLYRLPSGWSLPAALLEDVLGQHPLRPCGGLDMRTRGWVPCALDERLLYSQGQEHLFALGIEQKLLPAAVIRQHTEERAAQLAEQQGHPVGRRQRREIKSRVTDELMARALSRRSRVHAWLSAPQQLLAVDAASPARAELLTETLRDNLGGFAVRPLASIHAPVSRMAGWLASGEVPGPFVLDDDLELRAPDSGATIRYARHPLGGREIRAHLEAGLLPRRLGLTWRDRIACVLHHDLRLTRVRFLHVAEEGTAGTEEAAERFDLDFALMTGELTLLIRDLLAALGGEEADQEPEAVRLAAV